MRHDREMQEALEADGEKLRQLTGEDHGPWFLDFCPQCEGSGVIPRGITVYEHGCGFSHDDTYDLKCDVCDGQGSIFVEAE